MVLHVKADSVRDMYQLGIGAHVSQSELLSVVRPHVLFLTARVSQYRAETFQTRWLAIPP